VLTGLLRGEMGYQGLLLTDSLEMGALETSGYPVPRAAVAACAAGADLLCISHGFEVHRRVHAALTAAVEQGEISRQRLDESVRRVLTTKARYGLLGGAPRSSAATLADVGSQESGMHARRLAAAAITIVKDEGGWLPLPTAAQPLIVELSGAFNPASGVIAPVVAHKLSQALGGEPLVLPADPGESYVRQVLERARGRVTIVATAEAGKYPGQVLLVRVLHEAGVRLIVAAVGGPYDLMYFPEVSAYVACYGANPPTVDALADVLTGRLPGRGRLPVQL
jgi:beta-N-acetylhexosaminidase